MLKSVFVGDNDDEVLLRSHDGGSNWFSDAADVLEHRRRQKETREYHRRTLLNSGPFQQTDLFLETKPEIDGTVKLSSPEKELWLSVLINAVHDLKSQKFAKGARAWFESHLHDVWQFFVGCRHARPRFKIYQAADTSAV